MSTAVRKKARVPDSTDMREVRCANKGCRAFLGYEAIEVGTIQINCRHCKKTTEVKNPPEIAAPNILFEARCASCGHFLYGQALVTGSMRVKCHGCGIWNTLEVREDSAYNPDNKVEKLNRPSSEA